MVITRPSSSSIQNRSIDRCTWWSSFSVALWWPMKVKLLLFICYFMARFSPDHRYRLIVPFRVILDERSFDRSNDRQYPPPPRFVGQISGSCWACSLTFLRAASLLFDGVTITIDGATHCLVAPSIDADHARIGCIKWWWSLRYTFKFVTVHWMVFLQGLHLIYLCSIKDSFIEWIIIYY